MYLTHYGRVGDVARLAGDLIEQIDAMVALARAADGHDDRHARLVQALTQLYVGRAERPWQPADGRRSGPSCWTIDIELNAQGLEVWLDRDRA